MRCDADALWLSAVVRPPAADLDLQLWSQPPQTMSAASTPDQQAQLLFPPNVKYNASRVYSIKFISSCFAGAVAGILGLENSLGFALFVLATLLTSACLYVKCKGRPAKYIPGGWWELVNPGQENIFSFILVWTLFYGAPVPATPLRRRAHLSFMKCTQASCMVRLAEFHRGVSFSLVLVYD